MSSRTVAAFGTWKSPLTAVRATAGLLRFDHLALDDGDVYWSEGRAADGGRYVIVRRTSDGGTTDITPPGFNARTRVHEYGGAAFTVDRGVVYFSNFGDQRVYRQEPGRDPEPLTEPGYFYADGRVDAARDLLLIVREDHTRGDAEPPSAIVAVPARSPNARAGDSRRGDEPHERVLVSGADFYSNPVLDPAGTRLAWLQWSHPNMPWDGTELWVADMAADGSVGARHRVAGGPSESIVQPEWSPDGTLHFVSDRTGWWNLYRASPGAAAPVEALYPAAAEFGKPQWVFGTRTYDFVTATELVVSYCERGRWLLALLDTVTRSLQPLELGLEAIEGIRAGNGRLFFFGGSPTEPAAVVGADPATRSVEVLRHSSPDRLDAQLISAAAPITFRSQDEEVHAFYYAPHHPAFAAPGGERPPLIVLSHGGPTVATNDVLDARVQFWTSRGFAVLDVNYRGSTGYGRAYRDRLKGQWGIVDVADAVNGARHLVELGKADPNRLIIRGGSAGGYTTLAALTFHTTFKAGASYYGISDIEVLARETHKFESRYLDSLVGSYPAAREIYRQRSPIHFTDRLSCALILFQGLDDKVVPPNQSEMMADAVRRKGLPVAYVSFAGEQHGFRKAENIVRCLESELYFYGAVFDFEPADPIEPVSIDNL